VRRAGLKSRQGCGRTPCPPRPRPAHRFSASSPQCSASVRSRLLRGTPVRSRPRVKAPRTLQGGARCCSRPPAGAPSARGRDSFGGLGERRRAGGAAGAEAGGDQGPPGRGVRGPGESPECASAAGGRRPRALTGSGDVEDGVAVEAQPLEQALHQRRVVLGWGAAGWRGCQGQRKGARAAGWEAASCRPRPGLQTARLAHPHAPARPTSGSTPIESPAVKAMPLPERSSSAWMTTRSEPGAVSSLGVGGWVGARGGARVQVGAGRARRACSSQPPARRHRPTIAARPRARAAGAPRAGDGRPEGLRRAVKTGRVAPRALLRRRRARLARGRGRRGAGRKVESHRDARRRERGRAGQVDAGRRQAVDERRRGRRRCGRGRRGRRGCRRRRRGRRLGGGGVGAGKRGLERPPDAVAPGVDLGAGGGRGGGAECAVGAGAACLPAALAHSPP
jgi:hypothetical protein